MSILNGSATLVAAGGISANIKAKVLISGKLSVVGQIGVSPTAKMLAVATLGGRGVVAASLTPRLLKIATLLGGRGDVAANAGYVAVGTVAASGANQLRVSAVSKLISTTRLISTTSATAKASALNLAKAALFGNGGDHSAGLLHLLATTTLSGAGAFRSNPERTAPGITLLTGTGAALLAGSHLPLAKTVFSGRGQLFDSAVNQALTKSVLHCSSSLTANTVLFASSNSFMAGVGRCSFLLPQIHAVSLIQFNGASVMLSPAERWQVRPPIPAALAKPIQPYSRAA